MSNEDPDSMEANRRVPMPLEAIELWNFKSVHGARVELKPLTVLVGKNSAGKSSLIDTILIRTQAQREMTGTRVPLNGNLVQLGTFSNVLNNRAAEDFATGQPVGDGAFEGFRIGGELFISRDTIEDLRDRGGPRRWSSSDTRRLRKKGKALSKNEKYVWIGPDPYSALRNPAIRECLFELFAAGMEGSAQDMILRWWTEVIGPDDARESYGVARKGLVELLDVDGEAIFSAKATFEGSTAFAIHPEDDSTLFTSSTATVGNAKWKRFAEPETLVAEAQALNGLPGAIRYTREAKGLVARGLIRYWFREAQRRERREQRFYRATDTPKAWLMAESEWTRNYEVLERGYGSDSKQSSQDPSNHRLLSELNAQLENATQRLRSLRSKSWHPGSAGDPDLEAELMKAIAQEVALRSQIAARHPEAELLETTIKTLMANEEGRLNAERVEMLNDLPGWEWKWKSWSWDIIEIPGWERQLENLLQQAAHWVDFYLAQLDTWWNRIDDGERIRGFSEDAEAFFRDSHIAPLADLDSAREFAADLAKNITDRNSDDKRDTLETVDLEPPESDDSLLKILGVLATSSRWNELADRTAQAATSTTNLTAIVTNSEANALLRALCLVVRDFLADRVYFVGPLRLEPRSHYEALPQGIGRDVGKAGQFTAALISQLGDSKVVSPRMDGHHKTETLNEALNYWLGPEGLNLVAKVEATPQGELGYGLRVQPIGLEQMVHLNAVGMGVSQILPVIVQGLIAPHINTVIILQQPELHLHPALQQGLGDFLLALSMSGRQVILETHSNHIAERLARRVAENDSARRYIDLKLVDRTSEEGTTYQTAPIDQYGITEWPKGFFDESTTEAVATLSAGFETSVADGYDDEKRDDPAP